MMQQAMLMMTFLVAIAAIACGTPGDPTSNGPVLGGTAITGRSKADLENAVKAKFNTNEQLRAADLGVSADTSSDEITLSGYVESEALRCKAVDLTRSVDSRLTVNDQIEVKPSGRTADAFPDQQRHG